MTEEQGGVDLLNDPAHFLWLADQYTAGTTISLLLQEAIRLANYVFPTTQGLVVMWSTQQDPEHWGFGLIRLEGNFFVTAGGSRFATTLYHPQLEESEMREGHQMLLRSLEEMLHSPLLPNSPRYVLEHEMDGIRRVLKPQKAKRSVFGFTLP